MNQAVTPTHATPDHTPWLEAAAFGLALCDADFVVLHANRRFGEMLGLDCGAMHGRKLFEVMQLQERQRVLAGQALEQQHSWQGLLRCGARALKVDIRENGSGGMGGHVVSAIDYSADLDHLQKLTEAKNNAEKSNEVKSQFLSHMSHELRTPLNAIIGFTQLLKISDRLDPVERDNLAEIEKAGSSLLALINEILDLSKIEAGKLKLSEEHVDLAALAQECVQLVAPLAAAKHIHIDTRIDADSLLLADHSRLKQILLNLLSNAIKYNCQGGTVCLHSLPAADNRLRLEIRDSGPGIAPELLQTIFSPFDRLGAGSGSIEGSGIGLMITRRLVALMQGEIGVFSLLGRGSVFWVELPRKRLSLLESMLHQIDSGTAGDTALYGPLVWIGARSLLLDAFERLRELRPALELRHFPTLPPLDALCAEQPGLILVTEAVAASLNTLPQHTLGKHTLGKHTLGKQLKGARLHVVMTSGEGRSPSTGEQGESMIPVYDGSRLTTLLDLLDSFMNRV